jgi:transposase InsO family protein
LEVSDGFLITASRVTVTVDPAPSLQGANLMVSLSSPGPLQVGTPETLTATLTDASAHPIGDFAVQVLVTGANPTSSTLTTNASGVATFTYAGAAPGTDILQATAFGGTSQLAATALSVGWTPSQTWRTFLDNHVGSLASIDFFTVPTATFRVLYVFFVLAHDRRRVLHFNVTEHPSATWTAQQILEAFPADTAPRFMIRDRDCIFGDQFRRRVQGLGINEVLTAPRSPWQNPYAERLVGSVRRECLDHVIVLGERHLHRIVKSYFAYYHRSRTHLSLSKDAPVPRNVCLPGSRLRRRRSRTRSGHSRKRPATSGPS